MKIYKNTLCILIAIAGVFTSCNDDDFIKEVTESSYTYTNAFTVSSQVLDCVTELYVNHRSILIPESGMDHNWFLNGNGTDVSDATIATNSAAVGVSNFMNWTTTYGRTGAAFVRFYQLIAKANLALDGAEKVTWANPNQKIQAIAQAKFFRGYAYMNLAELFGGVPINEIFYEIPKLDFQRATREETYLYAISQLEAAVADLPEHPEAGRVGKGVAYHFLAETLLALACDQNNDASYLDKSIQAASEVMKYHSLMKTRFGKRANPASTEKFNNVAAWFPDGDVYFDLFQRGNFDYQEGNLESLWVLQSDYRLLESLNKSTALQLPRAYSPVLRSALWKAEYVEKGAAGSPWNVSVMDEFRLTLNISAYIGGRSQARVQPTNFTKKTIWENCGSDIRNSPINIRRGFKVLDPKHSLHGFEINEENASKYITPATLVHFGPVYTKFAPYDDYGYEGIATGKSNRDAIYSDFYFVRLAETYLLRAEAKLRKNDKKGAAADINEVRGRASATLVSEADVTIDYILDERIRELYGEERRWNTLLRMGGNIPNDRITKHAYWIVDYPTWSGTLGNDFLFPIPQSVIDSNLDAVIEQNPGWKSSQ